VWCEHSDNCMSQDEHAKTCIARTLRERWDATTVARTFISHDSELKF
jgi:hypothetical protein